MFDDAVKIALTGPPWRPEETRVYPALTAEFESTSHRNIFVAGSASHGLDRYRYKASGGFIHGFRFNVQTLYRILDNRYERDAGSNPSGDRSLPLSEEGGSSSFEWLGNVRRKGEKRQAPRMDDFGKNTSWLAARSPLWQKLVHRVNNAAGPYEMVAGSLADTIVYDCKNKKAWYLEDLPDDMIHTRYLSYPRITWSYYYGSTFRFHEKSVLCVMRSGRLAQLGTFIHPVLQYFPPGVRMPLPSERAWNETMSVYMSHQSDDHPGVFWEETPGVSRIHLPDQFVWTDWEVPITRTLP